ncbi:MAG: hypothetical protein Q7Q71_06230 [Verrucomicrobiota bacterium JB023]|nr:hypothetical protein [Verrucomicrobiota bacterium JB023]
MKPLLILLLALSLGPLFGEDLLPADKVVPQESLFKGGLKYNLEAISPNERLYLQGEPMTVKAGYEFASLDLILSQPEDFNFHIYYFPSPAAASKFYREHLADIELFGDIHEKTESDETEKVVASILGRYVRTLSRRANVVVSMSTDASADARTLVTTHWKTYDDYLAGLHQSDASASGAKTESPLIDKSEWTSSAGKTIQGSITSFNPDKRTVTLRRADGKVFEGIRLDKFSAEDQKLILEKLSP